MTYRQLTQDERYMIVQLRRERCGLSEMARLMGRARSTIWRELKRNMIPTRHGLGYCVSKAQEQRNGRLRRSRRGSNYSAEDYALVRRLLLEQWSPEQIAGTLGRLNELKISHQTIYRYIRRDWRSGSTPKSRTVVKELKTSSPALRLFFAFSGCGTARCIRTHRPLRHRASDTSCGKPARA